MKIRSFSKDGKRYIKGYASVFNKQSRIIFEGGRRFKEIIKTGSFDEVLRSEGLNVIANTNHNDSNMLGRTKSGTLKLYVDDYGLRYEIEVPDTQLGNDTYEQVKRGDIFESSFRFGSLEKNVSWSRDRQTGELLRFVNKVDRLADIALVTNGAYASTNIEARNMSEDFIANSTKPIEGFCENGICQRFSLDNEINIDMEVEQYNDLVGRMEAMQKSIVEITERFTKEDEEKAELERKAQEKKAELERKAQEKTELERKFSDEADNRLKEIEKLKK